LFPDIERLLRALSTGSGARRALIPGRRVASRAPLGGTMLAPRTREGKPIQKIDSIRCFPTDLRRNAVNLQRILAQCHGDDPESRQRLAAIAICGHAFAYVCSLPGGINYEQITVSATCGGRALGVRRIFDVRASPLGTRRLVRRQLQKRPLRRRCAHRDVPSAGWRLAKHLVAKRRRLRGQYRE